MAWTVRDVMVRDVHTVAPDVLLPVLERAFLEHRVTGFPVVDAGRLVGIVSRSDVVRQLCVEQTMAESFSDYYSDPVGPAPEPLETLDEIGTRIGKRIERLRVKDVMIHELVTAAPDDPLEEAAATLARRRIHRLPVVEGPRLVGIVTSLDLVRLIAEGRLQPV